MRTSLFRVFVSALVVGGALAGCGTANDSTRNDDSGGNAPGIGGGTGGDAASGGSGGNSGGSASGSGATGSGATGSGATGSGAAGSGGAPGLPLPYTVQSVTKWRNDAGAAYTMFHDDTCDPGVDSQFNTADGELHSRNLVASFGAIASFCTDRNKWSSLETLRSHGHEIVNHSWDHPNFLDLVGSGKSVATVAAAQIDAPRTALQSHLSNYVATFFIFPQDAFNDEFIAYLSSQGYLGSRAGERGLNSSDFDDDFRLKFDVFGPNFSIYATQGAGGGTACDPNTDTDACRSYILNHYVDDVIANSGYGIREMHGVGPAGNGWEPVPTAVYTQHLDYVKGKVDQGQLWVGTASDVIRYRHAREACALPTVSVDQMTWSSPSADCAKYATGLSYVLSPTGAVPSSVTASQNGAAVSVTKRGDNTLLVTADPSKGPVIFGVVP